MYEINNVDGDTLHILHRAMNKKRLDDQLYRNEMICQKLNGAALIVIGLAFWKFTGFIEWGIVVAPIIIGGIYLICTEKNWDRINKRKEDRNNGRFCTHGTR